MIFLRTIVVFLLFSNFLFSQESIIKTREAQPETILFIGNSYLYYGDSLHNHFDGWLRILLAMMPLL